MVKKCIQRNSLRFPKSPGLESPRAVNRSRRGAALVTTLLLSLVLFLLTLTFLYFSEQQYRFAGLQERQNQAYFLALAGLEYYRSRPEEFAISKTIIRPLPLDSEVCFFEVTLENDGTLVSRGFLRSPLSGFRADQVIERTVVVPGGSLEKMYDSTRM